jgi:hypothetical protein
MGLRYITAQGLGNPAFEPMKQPIWAEQTGFESSNS